MGLDRFANFISKSINNNAIEELYINDNIRKIISNHIMFDINFLIYQEIVEIENEINDIIKILLCYHESLYNINIIEELLNKILLQDHWCLENNVFKIVLYNFNFNIEYYNDSVSLSNNILLNNLIYKIITKIFSFCNLSINNTNENHSHNDSSFINNENDIIQNFIYILIQKFSSKIIYNNTTIELSNISLLDLIIYKKITNTMIYYIDKLHYNDFIISLSIYFDGIPSMSKIIEQRRRRIKNYLESIEKKII